MVVYFLHTCWNLSLDTTTHKLHKHTHTWMRETHTTECIPTIRTTPSSFLQQRSFCLQFGLILSLEIIEIYIILLPMSKHQYIKQICILWVQCIMKTVYGIQSHTLNVSNILQYIMNKTFFTTTAPIHFL